MLTCPNFSRLLARWLRRLIVLGLACTLNGLPISAADPAPERVYIVANTAVPVSVEIAEYYAEQRNIPRENILRLKLPTAETISPRVFIDHVFNPIALALVEAGAVRATLFDAEDALGREDMVVTRHQVDYLVTTHGVPLRIHDDAAMRKTEDREPPQGPIRQLWNKFDTLHACVDSELALIPAPGAPLTGPANNPLFNTSQPTLAQRNQVIRVSRLDGPNPHDAFRLIDDALATEQAGLHGRAWVDRGGPHKTGDTWLAEVANTLDNIAWPTARKPGSARFDHADRTDGIALYFGWYAPLADPLFRDADFQFAPGAVALHIHSTSAASLRREKHWVPALIARGATATLGNVYEPYLELTHQPQIVLRALLRGWTWGEATWAAVNCAGWQGVIIGDPLYRPFAGNSRPDSTSPYSIVQMIGREAPQTASGLAQLADTYTGLAPSPVIDLAVAERLIELGDTSAAQKRLEKYLEQPSPLTVDMTRLVLGAELAEILFRAGDARGALRIFDALISRAGDFPEMIPIIVPRGIKLAEAYVDMDRIATWRALLPQDPQP